MLNLFATFCRRWKHIAGACLALALANLAAPPAEARHWRPHHRHYAVHAHFAGGRHHRESIRFRHVRAAGKTPDIAAVVADGNSGRTLYARNENDLRFPASITKVMTLYLLFEELEQGHLRLDSDIRVSASAAAQKPTKLGLRAGATIGVEDAIKAVVTRSANDIAVAIAETIGGSEERFAELMTSKAHALGMASTHFANASGLPNAGQVTTAHDLAILGRAIQERFPRYYRYFATRTFYFHGAAIANHNHLLGRVEGMDGIKTGYTNASGFNLLTSVKRDGHYIVAVVLGGSSARSRDRLMADLIEDQIENGAAVRTASSIADTSGSARAAEAGSSRAADQRVAAAQAKSGPALGVPPGSPKPEAAIGPIQVASLNGDLAREKPRPAFVPGAPKFELRVSQDGPNGSRAAADGSTSRSRPGDGAALPATTPSALRAGAGRAPSLAGQIASAQELAPQGGSARVTDGRRPAALPSGWMIQVGATNDIGKAAGLLARAKSECPKALARAQAFTEKIQKGPETLYRARFAGLGEDSAEAACKALKRSGLSCFTTKN